MADVQIRISKPIAIVALGLGMPAIAVIVAVLSWVIATELFKGRFDPLALPVILIVALFGRLLWVMTQHWESLFTTFRVSDAGVEIENRRYGAIALQWSEIDSASYNKLFGLVTLHSSKLSKPIGIMNNNTAQMSEEFEAALEMVRKYLAGRIQEQLV
ncbi:YdbT family protein [Steroidobacter agaridevorans]|uniref:hypothetical protein n=1 Tax=Steroidobacter agaridevorans TaxID=2695856 RepID=UPI0013288913|nr:hypothetical protein [Steroidobacter agaridevorans]GFE90459.1 hypothetical protein GCM10011488_54130 [Steroidobacter agaridevorans]